MKSNRTFEKSSKLQWRGSSLYSGLVFLIESYLFFSKFMKAKVSLIRGALYVSIYLYLYKVRISSND